MDWPGTFWDCFWTFRDLLDLSVTFDPSEFFDFLDFLPLGIF